MSELEIFEKLRSMYPAGEYALLPQVRNGTGYTKVARTADAIAISLWPSRGIDMIGFEFKDSRSDALRELANPAKSDEIGRHCAFWWLVVSDPKLISKDELPSAWGLIAIKDGAAKKIVQAPRRKAAPPDLPMLASMMKAAAGSLTGENEVQRRIAAAVASASKDMHDRYESEFEKKRLLASSRSNDLESAYQKYKSETGIDIMRSGYGSRALGEAVNFVMNGGLENLSLVAGWCERVGREAKQLLGDQECHS